MTNDALQTNANFQQVRDELTLLGDEATRNPVDDPLYQQFIQRYPADRLPLLSLSEYCVGKGEGESFCWWLEHGLKPLFGRLN
jgi:5-methylcytosine-specific restriction protein B